MDTTNPNPTPNNPNLNILQTNTTKYNRSMLRTKLYPGDKMKIKILIHTPKNQAAKCITSLKDKILTIKQSKHQLIKQKITAHNQFYWIIRLDSDKDYDQIIKKAARADLLIKQFYKTLFKWVHRANKLANKFKKGSAWIKNWITKQIRKQTKDSTELIDYIQNSTEEEFKNILTIDDTEDMNTLLNRESTIIITKI